MLTVDSAARSRPDHMGVPQANFFFSLITSSLSIHVFWGAPCAPPGWIPSGDRGSRERLLAGSSAPASGELHARRRGRGARHPRCRGGVPIEIQTASWCGGGARRPWIGPDSRSLMVRRRDHGGEGSALRRAGELAYRSRDLAHEVSFV
jgi:hypothetical protein